MFRPLLTALTVAIFASHASADTLEDLRAEFDKLMGQEGSGSESGSGEGEEEHEEQPTFGESVEAGSGSGSGSGKSGSGVMEAGNPFAKSGSGKSGSGAAGVNPGKEIRQHCADLRTARLTVDLPYTSGFQLRQRPARRPGDRQCRPTGSGCSDFRAHLSRWW